MVLICVSSAVFLAVTPHTKGDNTPERQRGFQMLTARSVNPEHYNWHGCYFFVHGSSRIVPLLFRLWVNPAMIIRNALHSWVNAKHEDIPAFSSRKQLASTIKVLFRFALCKNANALNMQTTACQGQTYTRTHCMRYDLKKLNPSLYAEERADAQCTVVQQNWTWSLGDFPYATFTLFESHTSGFSTYV